MRASNPASRSAMNIGPAGTSGPARPVAGARAQVRAALLRWFANYGLSLSGADCVLTGAEERDLSRLFALFVQPPHTPT